MPDDEEGSPGGVKEPPAKDLEHFDGSGYAPLRLPYAL